ncbi:MAG: phosphoglycerate kinase [Chloroflexi bacterium]|nr:MAG: phosphoglycerate kinase [Chloroflexota bacterium]
MKASIRDVDVAGKRVLVREDLNVPLKDGRVTDETRIEASAPTLKELARRHARVIVTSHLGRPKGAPNPEFSLEPVAERLAARVGLPVSFARDCVGKAAQDAVDALQPGHLVLLENVRFHAEEEKNDAGFARALAGLGEVYCNDAFAASHRAHASVVGVAGYLPAYAGDLMLAELHALHRALDEPRRPLVAIVGGAKVSTKAGVLRHLLPRVDSLIVCGAMANTFFAARGIQMGSSLVEPEAFDEARNVERQAGAKLVLPVDGVVAREMKPGQETRTVAMDAVEDGWRVLDVGPKTRELYARRLRDAGTIVWNGPPGVFEIPEFAAGTRALGEAIASTAAYSLVGGGDTAAAVEQLGLGPFSHVSTGGGATLEYMEGKELPGVAVLKDEK